MIDPADMVGPKPPLVVGCKESDDKPLRSEFDKLRGAADPDGACELECPPAAPPDAEVPPEPEPDADAVRFAIDVENAWASMSNVEGGWLSRAGGCDSEYENGLW